MVVDNKVANLIVSSFCAVHYVVYVSSQVRIILATGNM